VVWGPKPTELKYRPIGANQAAEITWSVQVRCVQCPTAKYAFPFLLAWNYKLTFEQDQSGYTTRTYSGHFIIPQTRTNNPINNPNAILTTATINNTIQHTADELFEKILPAPLPGFRRVYGPRVIDESKCRCDFSIKDVELPPTQLPPGVVDAQIEHAVQSEGTLGFGGKWSGSFSGTVEMARDQPPGQAFFVIQDIVQTRLNAIKQVPYRVAPIGIFGGGLGAANPNVVIINRMAMAEQNIFGKAVTRFFVGYSFLSSLADILKASGLYVPVPSANNWNAWKTSLQNTALNPRGNAKLKVLASDDVILDLCQQIQQPPTLSTEQISLPVPPTTPTINPKSLQNEMPSSGQSWLVYNNRISYEQSDETVEVKLLPQNEIPITPPANDQLDLTSLQIAPAAPATSESGGASLKAGVMVPGIGEYAALAGAAAGGIGAVVGVPGNNGSPGATLNNQNSNSVVQVRNRPSWYAITEGIALRAGYEIQAPKLISVGGITVIPQNRSGMEHVTPWLAASWFGVPIYGLAWRQRYLIPGIPSGNLFTPGNPVYGS
jgi:hypothetical protein